MAQPNYQYEKRQKDLAKQRKKQEKEQEKAQRKLSKTSDVPQADTPDTAAAEEPAPEGSKSAAP